MILTAILITATYCFAFWRGREYEKEVVKRCRRNAGDRSSIRYDGKE